MFHPVCKLNFVKLCYHKISIFDTIFLSHRFCPACSLATLKVRLVLSLSLGLLSRGLKVLFRRPARFSDISAASLTPILLRSWIHLAVLKAEPVCSVVRVLCCRKYFKRRKMNTISLVHASAGIPKHWPALNDSCARQTSM